MENIGFGVVKNLKKKWMISWKIPDSPPPQQDASDPISGLTELCVHLSCHNYFLPKLTSSPECCLDVSFT